MARPSSWSPNRSHQNSVMQRGSQNISELIAELEDITMLVGDTATAHPRVSAAHTTLQTEEAEEYFSAEEDEIQCGENDGQARRKEGGTKKKFEDTEAFSYVREKMDKNAVITDKLFMQLRVQELKQELARACFDAKQQEEAASRRLAEHQEQVYCNV
jgi:hypothetical protein